MALPKQNLLPYIYVVIFVTQLGETYASSYQPQLKAGARQWRSAWCLSVPSNISGGPGRHGWANFTETVRIQKAILFANTSWVIGD